MSDSHLISVVDFNLFLEVMKSTSKIVSSAKINVDENGLQIYGARERIARCEITSNSIYSDSTISFSILELNKFVKVLSSIKEIHDGDYTDFKFIVDLPFIKFQSKKFKTKITTCKEEIIEKWTSKKIEAELQSVMEFITTSDYIKRINSHSFIFDDIEKTRIYLTQDKDMEKNSVFATVGNKSTNLNNEITLKLGLLSFGGLEDREIILDLERLNLFNALQSNEIKIKLMNMNFLVGESRLVGKNNSFFNLKVLNTTLKS